MLKGTKQEAAAKAVVDWLLSPAVQGDLPLSDFVFPVRTGVPLPDVFKFAAKPAQPLTIESADIDANREKWVDAWTKVVLR